MKERRLLILAAAAAVLVEGIAVASHLFLDTPGAATAAARNFLAALDPERRARAVFPFEGDERTRWHFIPPSQFERKGLPVKDMDPAQRALAHALLATAMSGQGYVKATTIMSLEAALKDLEGGRGPVRDPELYYFAIFGEPSDDGTWGLRVEGHHLSVHLTVAGGKVAAVAPAFLGANPAEVREGPRRGLRVLRGEEDLGRELVRSLDPERLRRALLPGEAPREIITGNARKAEPGPPAGIPAGDLTTEMAARLTRLIDAYARNLPGDVAARELARIDEAGFGKVRFAWAGGLERGQPHYYRIQGPTFLIEYDDVQNGANHIHCVWRGIGGDWGEDLLRLHRERDHAPGPRAEE